LALALTQYCKQVSATFVYGQTHIFALGASVLFHLTTVTRFIRFFVQVSRFTVNNPSAFTHMSANISSLSRLSGEMSPPQRPRQETQLYVYLIRAPHVCLRYFSGKQFEVGSTVVCPRRKQEAYLCRNENKFRSHLQLSSTLDDEDYDFSFQTYNCIAMDDIK
jgi:hypothetical protein